MKRFRTETVIIALFLTVTVVMAAVFCFGSGVSGQVPLSAFHGDAPDREPVSSEIIDLNTATEHELRMLPGVGEVIAERIVSYRKEFGPFSSAEELMQVSGIGEDTFSRLQDFVTVR